MRASPTRKRITLSADLAQKLDKLLWSSLAGGVPKAAWDQFVEEALSRELHRRVGTSPVKLGQGTQLVPKALTEAMRMAARRALMEDYIEGNYPNLPTFIREVNIDRVWVTVLSSGVK
jgi:hypothetical protein